MVRRKRAARLLSKAELMELLTHAPSAARLPGDWESLFTGAGLEFHGLREMAPSDPYRHVDWRATARTGRPWVREFNVDGTVDLILLLDAGRSMAFGDKGGLQANVAAALLMSASRGHNPCGLIRYDDRIRTFLPPGRGGEHRFRLAEAMLERPSKLGGNRKFAGKAVPKFSGSEELYSSNRGAAGRGQRVQLVSPGMDRGISGNRRSDLAGALRFLVQRFSTGLIVILSDFLHELSIPFSFGNRDLPHDVRAIQISAPSEIQLPPGGGGFLPVRDLETGRRVSLDTRRRREYAARMDGHHRTVRQMLNRAGIPMVQVRTDEDFVGPLSAFFRRGRGR
jgi:uncharacterized protein (DUF58 family)